MRLKKYAAYVLVSMLLLSGCGQKDIVLDEYGNGSAESSDENSTEKSSENDSESSQENKSETSHEGSTAVGKTLTEKLGGETLEYHEDFSIGTKTANIDVRYTVR